MRSDLPATYAVTGGADAALFSVSGSNLVYTGPARDYDASGAQHSFDVEVTATDAAGNVGAAHTITVSLTNLNDTAPVVTTATGSLDENADGSTTPVVVAALSSTDADALASDLPATYAVTGGADAALFSVSGSNLVYTGPARDYDASGAQHSFDVEVTATDAAGNVGAAHTITVSLTNLNDTAPVVTTATGSLDENADGSTTPVVVAALSSTDADALASDLPATYAVTGGADAALFTISGSNLVFTGPARDYDRRTAHSYAVEVTATDGAGNTVRPTPSRCRSPM